MNEKSVYDYKTYTKAVDTLNNWAHHYYVLDNPITTDDVYDNLYHTVVNYEKNNPNEILNISPTQRVGDVLKDGFKKERHLSKMWSLEDIFDNSGLQSWLDKIHRLKKDISFYCEPKYDGASLNLIYDNGMLIKAITRGDGEIGELVTQNAKTIHTIPLTIPEKSLIEIRGEVVIYKSTFDKINKARLLNNESLFSNPRNMASGSLRQLDPIVTYKRDLVFLPYGVGMNSLDIKLLSDKMKYVYDLGFKEPPLRSKANTINEIESIYEQMHVNRNSYPMMLDGMVIKIDNIDTQDEIGYTVKVPRWAVAYKFPAVEKITTVENIINQVGRTGVVTPVAIVTPIEIDGVIVERATLHNFKEIKKMDMRIGDKIIILRSGDVIPKITKVLTNERNGNELVVVRPTYCPVCNEKLLYEDILTKCQNIKCSARVINTIAYFASKKCLDIDGLGVKVAEDLYNYGLVNNLMDVYNLTTEKLLEIDGFKHKKATNLINSINNTINIELWRFIRSFGIEHIGQHVSKIIAERYGMDYCNLDVPTLLSIDSIGDEIANSYVNFMSNNLSTVKKLESVLKPTVPKIHDVKENPFKGKTVVLTGTMYKPRDIIKKELELLGANISNNVSKKTDYLIYGENAGSKYDKAIKLNVTIITDKNYEEMKCVM